MGIIKGRRFIVTGGGGNPDPSGNTMTFAINFASAPNGVSLSIPKYKFDKKYHLGIDWDDGTMRINNPVIAYMNSLKYSDGCGNQIGYTATIALNSGFGQVGDDGFNYDYLQVPQIRDIINLNWDFGNHGLYHQPSPTSYDDTIRLDNLLKLRANYAFNTTIVPTNFLGYTQAAFDLGYIMSTSQADRQGDAWSDQSIRVYKNMPVMNTEPVFIYVIRDFTDEWELPQTIAWLKSEIDKFALGTSDFEKIGTHNPLTNIAHLNNFKIFMDYVQSTTNDQCLVCSTREFLEYRQMAIQPISQVVEGDQLIVTVDISNLSVRNRWRDLSFNVSGGTVTGVEPIEGIASTSFNPTTGMVNIFKQKTVWS